ncbi:glutathione S-transferase [Larsenimonas suaedae]|uniref:Glutathione S-transferase n=1 Tax=Larsenimonas suaedae TaxID=1851019 RepID=A0ABU1GSM7_9GAMM|nr:glutathione S-transferase [Larsenimonas suaedae]MCM2972184.1 glutathione S-transferase [Larsenimonas suaedae]MDR5895020.1 glutathione S-transferase [Larsenimonas suaedae]
MIKVHHLDQSRSQRILWLLEELGLEYELVCHSRNPVTMRAPDSLKAVHPLGKAPVIEHDGVVVSESGYIIEYLCSRFDPDHQLMPRAGTPAFEQCRYWLHYAEGSAMPPLVMSLIFSKLGKPPVPWFLRLPGRLLGEGVRQKHLTPEIKTHIAYWDKTLTHTGWFAGNALSAADVQMSFPVMAAASRAGIEGAPAVADWLERVRARPGWKRAIERGGPFAY